jgi:hypothetical protein
VLHLGSPLYPSPKNKEYEIKEDYQNLSITSKMWYFLVNFKHF